MRPSTMLNDGPGLIFLPVVPSNTAIWLSPAPAGPMTLPTPNAGRSANGTMRLRPAGSVVTTPSRWPICSWPVSRCDSTVFDGLPVFRLPTVLPLPRADDHCTGVRRVAVDDRLQSFRRALQRRDRNAERRAASLRSSVRQAGVQLALFDLVLQVVGRLECARAGWARVAAVSLAEHAAQLAHEWHAVHGCAEHLAADFLDEVRH